MLLREILAGAILLPAMDKIADPVSFPLLHPSHRLTIPFVYVGIIFHFLL